METGVTDIAWTLDKRFKDTSGNEIQILQRRLHDLIDAGNNELLPFFNEPSLFQIRSAGSLLNTDAVRGILVDWKANTNKLDIRIKRLDGLQEMSWTIENVTNAMISIWRVNNILDALQVLLTGTHNSIYMQVGGTALTDICLPNATGELPAKEMVAAMELFYQNIGRP